MSIEVKVPQLPESVADATLISWHRKAGEAVRRDENLVDLETDKVVLEVPAPSDGVLKEIKVGDGTTVTAGQVLALLEPGEAAAEKAPEPEPESKAEKAPEPSAETAPEPRADKAPEQKGEAPEREADAERDETPAAPEKRAAEAEESAARAARTQIAAAPSAEREEPGKMGPAVRKLVEEHDLDPADITGSGREGRITKADVLEYMASRRESTVGVDSEGPVPMPSAPSTERGEQRVTMTRLRARIAERLVEAQHTAAMLTTFNEVDMTEVMALRKRYQEPFQARYDIKLGFMSFFVKACIEGLRRYPMLNASVDGNEIVYHEYFDIGVAVSTERGLVVPVLRNAEHMSVADVERGIADFGRRARAGALTMDDLTGGTFTITNGGIFGSLMSTPILNPPQSGIFGMHKIQPRPVVVDGEIVVRPMMYVALTYDHRIVDGREAVQYLVAVKEQLEDPARLILQV